MIDIFSDLKVELTLEQVQHVITEVVAKQHPEFSVKGIRFKITEDRDMRGESMGTRVSGVTLTLSKK